MVAPPPNLDVRTRILEAATRIFAERGFDGTSIQEVAESVGVTRPTLVYHFGSKDNLRLEVLRNLLSHWKEELPRAMAAATTGSDRFRSALEAVVSFFRADPGRARLLVREMLDHPAEMTALFREYLQPWTSLLTDYIRMGQREGRIRASVDPEAYVLQVLHATIATLATGAASMHILQDPPDVSRMIAELGRMAKVALYHDRPDPGDRHG